MSTSNTQAEVRLGTAMATASSTEKQKSSTSVDVLKDEPLSKLDEPLPLPPYSFDESLSEDENFLTWATILARHSASRKGHMGTIFVRPPTNGDPADEINGSPSCSPPARDRIIHYANNTPLLYSRLQKAVPEVHAEALVISRCARWGIALEGCTVYISFPPCNECMKLLLSAGVRRCVYKKAIQNKDAHGEAALVAAHVYGMSLNGTLNAAAQCSARGDEEGAARERAKERQHDEQRDQRVRAFWASVGEDAVRTRARVARWWDNYVKRYRPAEKIIKAHYGPNGAEQAEKARLARTDAKRAARREAQEAAIANKEAKKEAKSDTVQHDEEEEDMDALMNGADTAATLKRPSVDAEENSGATKHSKVTDDASV